MTDGVLAYDTSVAELCERALVTVIGRAGYWGQQLYLVGDLHPTQCARMGVALERPREEW